MKKETDSRNIFTTMNDYADGRKERTVSKVDSRKHLRKRGE